MEKSNANNRQVKRTRGWIIDALMILMDKKPYNEITVSDIVQKAGIARQTFYRSYDNKDDVLLQFFGELVDPQPEKIKNIFKADGRDILEFSLPLNQFVQHHAILKKILKQGAEQVIYSYSKKWEFFITEQYREKLSKDEQIIFALIVGYHSAGAIHLIGEWIKNDMPVPKETIAYLIGQLTSPFELAEHAAMNTAIPHLVIKILNEQ
jgi:AcrR family transcriptional regulator